MDRLYDKRLYEGIAREACQNAVHRYDTLLKLLNPLHPDYQAKVVRLKQLRAEWQEAAETAPEVGTTLSEEEIAEKRKLLPAGWEKEREKNSFMFKAP